MLQNSSVSNSYWFHLTSTIITREIISPRNKTPSSTSKEQPLQFLPASAIEKHLASAFSLPRRTLPVQLKWTLFELRTKKWRHGSFEEPPIPARTRNPLIGPISRGKFLGQTFPPVVFRRGGHKFEFYVEVEGPTLNHLITYTFAWFFFEGCFPLKRKAETDTEEC